MVSLIKIMEGDSNVDKFTCKQRQPKRIIDDILI